MEPYVGHRVEYLSGDGRTTTFALRHPLNEYVHDVEDPFTDGGIFRSNPKVEYPLGRRRWAVSHTYLAYPITDGALYDKEYTWDARAQTLTTHFHERVRLEQARTDGSGLRVAVAQRPISTGVYVRANRHTLRNSSAVRGVWDNPEKRGRNYYTRRAVVLTEPKLIFYFRSYHQPIVDQLGIWEVDEPERAERFFDRPGNCTSVQGVIEELRIPLHAPRILAGNWKPVISQVSHAHFETPQRLMSTWYSERFLPVPPPEHLEPFMGSEFTPGFAGYATMEQVPRQQRPREYETKQGYWGFRDVNGDERIDVLDQELLRAHQGEVWRVNVGDLGYFGVGWLSPGMGTPITPEHARRQYVAAYDYGGGYDPDGGVIHLLESPGANHDVYVEYHYDAPAAAGEDNIKVYLHR